MKIKTKLATVAWMFILCTSCGTNENLTDSSNEGDARLSFRITGIDAVISRNTGDALPTDEDKLNTITVGVFKGENVNVIKELTPEEVSNKTGELRLAPGEGQSVIVVGNAPSGMFTGVTTKSDFLAKTISLTDFITGDGISQQSDNLPMSGETTGLNLESGDNHTITVSISRLVARISIESISADFPTGSDHEGATFELTDIYMYNTMGTSTVATGTDPETSNLIKTAEITGTADYVALHNLNTDVTSTAYSKPCWFYVFANGLTNGTPTEAPTKIVLKGLFDPDGAGAMPSEVEYYPIVINKRQVGTQIEGEAVPGIGSCTVIRNKLYKISVVIKGRGITVPDGDLETALFNLNINVQPWAMCIEQDVVFGSISKY